jgi:hypothetical protein
MSPMPPVKRLSGAADRRHSGSPRQKPQGEVGQHQQTDGEEHHRPDMFALFGKLRSLFTRKFSLFAVLGNSAAKRLNSRPEGSRGTRFWGQGWRISLYFPA